MGSVVDKPPFDLIAVVTLARGTGTAVDVLRRYAALADELGACAVDVDDEQVDIHIRRQLVDVDLGRAMHAMAGNLIRRFGWRDEDFAFIPHLRYAEITEPASGSAATSLVIRRAGFSQGREGDTHDLGFAPDRCLTIDAAGGDVLARLFVTVPDNSAVGAAAALAPWLSKTEPAAIGLDLHSDGKLALLYSLGDPGPDELAVVAAAEARRLGLPGGESRRIAAGDQVLQIVTAADGPSLWLRRGLDPVTPGWPGRGIETREMVVTDSATEEQVASLMRTLAEIVERNG